ncbi:peptidase U35 phage prohead HK97 [Rhodomicrobium vannielii ATCC 17100]|uniref:Peptidase U35 phage prohead HK97 n=1 Tax=Rhodomicrobium vannielii (strain ATCC 17100 / DSM 162 / LMG 4299 / NCIMB 10020 / ATH 3.1.1) TaxID=648757 RepID=E3I859_RHOVT|nr:prohead protease/major capsid protein fusion protein [Rhodomicrobium vannielii]ADP71985.1 peptidase U35 phage prohead HK97 [Rhodomicrobium vannielii ATCC 17100]
MPKKQYRRPVYRSSPDEVFERRAPVSPLTWDEATRTIEAVISTGAPVKRSDSRGPYIERLDLSGVDPAKLVGLPILDAHRSSGSEHVVGVIREARRESAGLVAVIQLSAADDVSSIRTKVAEGTLRGLSIGYSAAAVRETTENGQRVRTITPAIREASFVATPADAGATVRGRTMPQGNENEDNQPTQAEHRARVRELVRAAGETPELADQFIDSELTEEQVRADLFDKLVKRSKKTPIIRVHSPAADSPDVRRAAQEEALFVRTAGGTPSEAAKPYLGHSLRDFARETLEAAGHSTRGLNTDELFRAAMHTTSDFPQLLTGVGRRSLLASYQAAQSPLKALARQSTRSDFRSGSTLRLGEIGSLQPLSEAGEIKSVTRGESEESYAIDSFGAKFSLSRKALINDDLGAFNDVAQAAGQAAAQKEAELLWSLLSQSSGAGPVMGEDNKRLFHADHGNLLTAAALSETSLSAARLALRTRKGLDKKTVISVVPKYLLVGPEIETAAEKLLTSITATTTGDVNPFAGKLTLLVEPRISGKAWYLFADPASVPVLEFSYLSSAPGPQISEREGWDVLSREYRVYLDFGAGAIDHRGAARNPGV